MNDDHPRSSSNGAMSTDSDLSHTEKAANEVRAMHTRLAELLDSVTVIAESETAHADEKRDQADENEAVVPSPAADDKSEFSYDDAEPFTSVAEKSAEEPETQLEHTPVQESQSSADSEGADTMSSLNLDERTETAGRSVIIKGRADGISIEIGAGSWRTLMIQLRDRLHQAAGFFRGGTVTLSVGSRVVTPDELSTVAEALSEHGMKLKVVQSSSEETAQAAAAFGVAARLASAEDALAQAAASNHDLLAHFVYRGNLRSGQILRRSETILVLGDVNPGAQVISEGDIFIWGRLRGIAHAGATGDRNAIISAMSMEPTQLRIDESVAIMPESQERRQIFGARKRTPELAPRPEVAHLVENQIVVEPWDETKPGGVMAFRRS